MKYGLVVYKDTDNIGDDILSYASCQYLPQIDYIVDRENLDTFVPDTKEYVAVILNGWFLHNKFNWTPSEYLLPLFIGIHFSPVDYWGTQEEYLDNYGTEYLKKYTPIGCRDRGTLQRMEKRGIDAYFSGCLTLTLQKFPNIQKTNKILLVDLPQNICEYIIRKVGGNVEIISHEQKIRGREWDERQKEVEDLLKKYQSASMVITTRLHCALPCLALETKVLVIERSDSDFAERMSTFVDYFHFCSYEDILQGKVDFQKIPENKEDYKVLAKDLREHCERFIQECNQRAVFELPEVSDFVCYWNRKIEWQRTLFKRWTEIDLDEIQDAKKWLAEQYDQITIELDLVKKHSEEQENYIQELLKGKDYLETRAKEQESYIQELLKGKDYLETHVKEQEKNIQELISTKEELIKQTEILNDRWVRKIVALRKRK